MSLRILVISQRFWPENTKINDICQGFIDRGYKVDVLCGQPNYPDGNYYPGYGLFRKKTEKHGKMRLLRCNEIKRDNGSSLRIVMNYYSFAISAFLRILLLQKNSYDAILIYQHSPVMVIKAGTWLGKRKRIPVTTYAVDVWPYAFYQEMEMQSTVLRTLFMKTSEKCYLASDKIITANQNATRFFTSQLHMHPSKVAYVPLCADEGVDRPAQDISIMENFAGSFNIVFIGRMDETNDFDSVFQVARELLKAGITDIKFILVGNGPDLKKLMKQASQDNLQDIVFFEPVTKLEKQLKFLSVANACLSIGIASKKGEYYPLSDVVDYMTAGKAVLAASGSNERHVVKQAKCGLASDPGDVAALFQSVMRLYKSSRQELEKYENNAIAYSKEHFNREDRIDEILDIMFINKAMKEEGYIISQNSNIIKMDED